MQSIDQRKTVVPTRIKHLKKTVLVLVLMAFIPQTAMAKKCGIGCQINRIKNKAREAAERAVNASREAAERAARESQAAAERAARETEAAANFAAQQATELAERLMREAFQKAIDAAFAGLRDAHLDELANVQKIGDADFWQETVLKAVMSSLSGLNITDEITKSADLLVKGVGTPTAEHPFGDGPFGVLVQNQTMAILQQTGPAAQKGLMSVMDPTKSPLSGDEIQVQTLSDYFEIKLPHPAKFKYEVAAAIKGELGQTIPEKRFDWLDTKETFQLKVPFIHGDFSETKTAFQSIVKDHRFKFQVAVGIGLATNKKTSEVVKSKMEVQLAFDVACSTQNIGQCQLQKITVKPKMETKRTDEGIDNLTKIKIVLDTMIDLMSQPLVTEILFASNSNKKREFTNTLAEIRDYVDFSIKVVNTTQPPTQHAVSNAIVMLNGMGMTDITRGFMARSQFADVLDSMYKFSGQKTEVKNISNMMKTLKYTYDETGAYEPSISFQYINQDVLDNRFRAGWKPVGGQDILEDTKDFALNLDDSRKTVSNFPKYMLSVLNFIKPQFFGVEIAKVGASEAKLEMDTSKAGQPGAKASIAMALDSKAAFGIQVALSSAAASYARGESVEDVPVTHAELNDALSVAGDDPYKIDATNNWEATEQPFVTSFLAGRKDALTLPTFMVLLPSSH